MSVLSAPYMHDEAAAFAHVEAMLWPQGPVCPFCGVVGRADELKGVRSKPSKKNPESVERHRLKKCRDCGKQFTVRKGTIFEESHIALHLWLQAIHLMTSSKKGKQQPASLRPRHHAKERMVHASPYPRSQPECFEETARQVETEDDLRFARTPEAIDEPRAEGREEVQRLSCRPVRLI